MRHRSGLKAPASLAAVLVLGLALGAPPARAEGWWDSLFHRSGEKPPAPRSVKSGAPPAATAPAAQAPAVNPPATTPAPRTAVTPAPVSPAAPATPPVVLPTIPVAYPKVQRFAEFVEVAATVQPLNTVKLVARVPGYLEQVHFADGQFVEEGDLLFTIEQAQYKAQLAQAEAQVKATDAALAYARVEAERYQGLQRKGAAAQVVVDNWNFQAKKTEAELASAQAQLEIARLNLGYTEVRAPFAGQMTKLEQSVGSMVGGAGQPPTVAEILQVDPIYVQASLDEKDFVAIRDNVGARRLTHAELMQVAVDVSIEGEAGFHLRGKIEYLAPAIDQQTGTILVRAIVHNPDRSLVPGLSVRMRLPRGKVIPNAVLVPDRVIQADQGGRYVLVVNRQNVIEQRHVQLGELVGGLRVALDGVRPDDRVVVSDLWRATPGLKVNARLVAIDRAESAAAGSQ